jgi:chromosome segregation ATPase
LLAADPRVFRSKTCLRGARASHGEVSAEEAARRGPGGGGWCRGEQGASTRTSLEAARQSAEDRAITAETAATTATTERDSLASRITLTEAEIEKLRAVAASAEVATERANTAAATSETATRDAAQAAARDKAALEARVSKLESGSSTATMDLATTSCQFS